jgi:ribosomal protein L34E
MVAGNKRSRSAKRMQRVTISGTKVVYKREKDGVARCQMTGQKLNGVPRDPKSKLTKSGRRPTRPFGGVLSPVAMRAVLKSRVRE